MKAAEPQACRKCFRPLKNVDGELSCPNGCGQLTAQCPDASTAASMSYKSMGDGCYTKKFAVIE